LPWHVFVPPCGGARAQARFSNLLAFPGRIERLAAFAMAVVFDGGAALGRQAAGGITFGLEAIVAVEFLIFWPCRQGENRRGARRRANAAIVGSR